MDVIKLESGIVSRARELTDAGLSEFDALHLACAEAGRANVFLTADIAVFGGESSGEHAGGPGHEPCILSTKRGECTPQND